MSKRRTLIILLFFVIGVFAISRTLLLRQGVKDAQSGQSSAYSRKSMGQRLYDPGREAFRKTWGRLLDRLLVVTVTLPFIITALLLFVYSLQVE